MTLLELIVKTLDQIHVSYALIGAAAMAVHRAGRSTFDTDLLTTDPSVLERQRWKEIAGDGVIIDIRTGEEDDPMAGVVRFRANKETVDLLVGRYGWQSRAVQRAERKSIGPTTLPVVTLADLILLKLFAGGIQDRWDIQQLLAANRDELVLPTIASEIHELPLESRALWKNLIEVDPSPHA